MIVIAWNCYGLARPHSERGLWVLLMEYNPYIVFLIETKVTGSRMKVLKKRCGFNYGESLDARGIAASVYIWGKKNVDAGIIEKKFWIPITY